MQRLSAQELHSFIRSIREPNVIISEQVSPHKKDTRFKNKGVNICKCFFFWFSTAPMCTRPYFDGEYIFRSIQFSKWLILRGWQRCWSQSQLTDRTLPVNHRADIETETIHSTSHTPTGNLGSPISRNVFGLLEEAGVSRGNPRRYEENVQTPHRQDPAAG